MISLISLFSFVTLFLFIGLPLREIPLPFFHHATSCNAMQVVSTPSVGSPHKLRASSRMTDSSLIPHSRFSRQIDDSEVLLQADRSFFNGYNFN